MTILDEIVDYKRNLIKEGYYEEKLKTLNEVDITHKSSFKSQLDESNQLAVIAEIKSKSPTLDQLPNRDLAQQVKDYEANGANAVSILTDEHYFGGSYERLQDLTLQTTLPVLCKDFVVDKIQIDVAKKAGASIILLIVNVLTDQQMKDLYQYATSLNLEVLVEVHDKEELERAYKLKPQIIGVNNRDLKRFVTDVLHTNEILENKKEGYYYISESGIRDEQDVANVVESGIDGLLIGESLMKCEDLSQFLPGLKLTKVTK
ncbi:indole-3-glycerol phosphate synthase [Staphylococcus saprophyticus]|jgi:indole-3-glycerol phosphate synthase|uniref:Indole-3-glycerol phosphate synthase n=1 Tax=Staphylococcus saprophyticus subsp. saprophyticus (strain ATCC 15305 / DSM 20229 / NCIMB 8711 / NCTC 7292 / S-41) TaxID=342451 RepID=TRPC_STAS1|nr:MULTISPECIES: indole-3-glycerol phosphate synthase TrpC [Staphylococcus]Q49XH6.1 RecName: Full=Indole-3-glycerol phosphate synthase; Short=IGPS [Staphylococcus saprophyticus subsp. saprophyticus ATCC 15305 = NCTC 7292]AMG33535.1 indole-3-glycerol-phosphate synthase [Staphylococcus saprophyticus]ASE59446.1 indole-3-glycerol-phosphate synthase [Staphylococcus saprophyticus]ASF18215.1 indole-3-glycerol-phosphate synthase [Staphylococcus saprophyticus]MBC2920930.1 indole-3-glycerol phosphate sy